MKLHHLKPAEVRRFAAVALRVCRRALILNDIRRSRRELGRDDLPEGHVRGNDPEIAETRVAVQPPTCTWHRVVVAHQPSEPEVGLTQNRRQAEAFEERQTMREPLLREYRYAVAVLTELGEGNIEVREHEVRKSDHCGPYMARPMRRQVVIDRVAALP